MKFSITAAARTHTGLVRGNNEDNLYLCGQYRRDISLGEFRTEHRGGAGEFLAAVCDGMGGETKGECASLLAVQNLIPSKFDKIRETAQVCIRQANTQICAEIEKNGGRRMGSTLAALYIDEGKAISCNIGDSRVYLLREGALRQLSTDHNKARRMIELGVLTPEQAARHPSRHELTQHLGIFEHEMILEPAFSETIELRPGDRFLLCSDGLTDMAAEQDISKKLREDLPPEKQAEDLVQMALEGGGRDNITVVVVHVKEKSGPFWAKIFPGQSA